MEKSKQDRISKVGFNYGRYDGYFKITLGALSETKPEYRTRDIRQGL